MKQRAQLGNKSRIPQRLPDIASIKSGKVSAATNRGGLSSGLNTQPTKLGPSHNFYSPTNGKNAHHSALSPGNDFHSLSPNNVPLSSSPQPPPPFLFSFDDSNSLKKITELHGGGPSILNKAYQDPSKVTYQQHHQQHHQQPHQQPHHHYHQLPIHHHQDNHSPSNILSPSHITSKLASSCLTCAEDISGRCSFCLREKSTVIPRMKLFELGKRILEEHPKISCEKLLHMLQDYGRSSKVALDLNERMSYGHGEQEMCDIHIDSLSDLSTKTLRLESDMVQMNSELSIEINLKNDLIHQLKNATKAIEDLSMSSNVSLFKVNELEQMAYEEVENKNKIIFELRSANQDHQHRIKLLEQRLGMSLPDPSDANKMDYSCEGCREANAQLRALKARWAEFLDVK